LQRLPLGGQGAEEMDLSPSSGDVPQVTTWLKARHELMHPPRLERPENCDPGAARPVPGRQQDQF
jgi:hypothetical protein